MKRRILIVCILILSLILGQVSFAFAATGSSDKPKAPTMNSAVLADDGSVDVVWSKVSGADKYEIYRATSKSGKYTKIATVSSKNRIYNDTDVKNYKNYYYKLKTVDDGKKSAYSKVVSAYVEGPRISNDKINYIIKWETGESHNMPAGDAISTTASLVNGTLKYKGMPTDNYKIFYDKENVTIKKGKNGKLQIMPKTPGRYQCTLIIGDEKGTITYDAEIGKYSDLTFSWSQNNWEQDSMSVKIPKYSESTLAMKYKGKAIKDFKVTSSNKNVCTVAKNGSKVTVTNKGPGKCNITVTYKGKKTIFQWIVKRGLATADYIYVDEIPVAKSVDPKEAKAAIKAITTTRYNDKQVVSWVKTGTSYEKWIDKVETPAEAVQLLTATGYSVNSDKYRDDTLSSGWIEDQGLEWAFKWTTDRNFYEGFGKCQGTSNLINALLKDDLQEQGYIRFEDNGGGHCFNYFKVNDLYVMCDFVGIPNQSVFGVVKYPADTTAYIIFVSSTPEELAEYYINYGPFAEDFRNIGNLHHLYMYPMEGVANAVAHDGTTPDEKNYWPYIPIEWNGQKMKDIMMNLYVEEGYEYYFVPLLDKSRWPEWAK